MALTNPLNKELFYSIDIEIDIETDGPAPLVNSMLQIGAVAFTLEAGIFATYSANLAPTPGAVEDPKTMTEFWAKYPEKLAYIRANEDPVETVIPEFCSWVDRTAYNKRPIAVCYPCGFDFSFIYTYCMKYNKSSPFGFSCLDVRSYAAAMMKSGYRDASKKNYPKCWRSFRNHTHDALDDALEQADLIMAMMQDNLAID